MKIDKKVIFEGQYYQDTVPDTFDLAERAAFALKAACACIDPDLHYWMWFSVHYGAKIPSMRHNFPDVDCSAKLLEAMVMLCHMTGDTENQEMFHEYLKSTFDYLEEDGLFWVCRAEKDRPWASVYNFNPADEEVKVTEDLARIGMTPKVGQLCLTLYQATGDDYWIQLAEMIQEGVNKVTIRKDDYAYIPPDSGMDMPFSIYRSGWANTEELTSGVMGHEGTVLDQLGFHLRTPVMMYQATGSELSKDLADRWKTYLMKPMFWGKAPLVFEEALLKPFSGNGDFTVVTEEPICIAGEELGHWNVHNHCTMRGTRAILDYGITMNDSVAVEFARRSFDFSWSMGIPKLGWIVDSPGRKKWMEGCSIGDLVAYAIRLCDAGAGDYWDQADAIVRNVLAEAQYLDPQRMKEISENAPIEEFPGSKENGRCRDGKDVIERTVGVFLSELDPDGAEMYGCGAQIMFCCMINCMTALFYAWEAAVREDGENAHVNLLFNRAAKGLDVYSHLPYEGRVEIKNKGKKQIFVRIPGWAKKNSVKLKINGEEKAYTMAGLFMVVSGLSGSEYMEIFFDVPQYTASYTVNARTPVEKKYTIRFRGSNAVDISPRNESPTFYPFYTDENMRTATKAGTKEVLRFVPDHDMKIW